MDLLPAINDRRILKLRIGKSASVFPKYVIDGIYNQDLVNQGTKWFSIFIDLEEWMSVATQIVSSGIDSWIRKKFEACEKQERRLVNEDVWNQIYERFFEERE